MHKAVDMILEAWEVKQPAKPQGQSIWQIAQRSNAKQCVVRVKQVSQYKRLGIA